MPNFWEGDWKYALLVLVFTYNLLFEIQQQSGSCIGEQFPPSTKAATQRSAEGCSGRQTLKASDNILIFDSHVQLYWQLYAILNSSHTTEVAAVSRFIKRWNSGLHILLTAAEPKYYQEEETPQRTKRSKLSCFTSLFEVTSLLPHVSTTQLKKTTEQTPSNETH